MSASDFLHRKIVLKFPVWTLPAWPLLVYAAWETYWYTKVGIRIVKWHTHVAVYVYLWVISLFFFQLLFRKGLSERAKNSFLVFTSVVGALAVMEIFLELSGTYKTYQEKVGGRYDSPFTPQDQTWYHGWTANKPHYITKPEYSFWRPTNSLGLADSEWTTLQQKGQLRWMTLGDSFTEGDGAPYDSSYVALLQNKLRAAGDTFYMMNAGVCGSDPFNNYIFLKNKLVAYKPDVIIQVLASNDLTTDILLRGGLERFQKDGTQKFKPGPWWEPLYAVSYISRIFFRMAGYNELLVKGDIKPEEEKWLNEKTADLFMQYAALCKENGIRLVVVLRPDRNEIEKNKYIYNFDYILGHLRQQQVQVVDLLPAYRQYMSKNNAQAKDYFWVTDGHHNSKGYEMMAQTIFENLSPFLRDSDNCAKQVETLR